MDEKTKKEIDGIKSEIKKIKERLSTLEGKPTSIVTKKELGHLAKRIKDFADKVGVKEVELRKIFDFDEHMPHISPSIFGSISERQRKFVMIFLTALRYVYGKDTMKASELSEMARDRGIYNTTFGTTIYSRPYIRRIGKAKSRNIAYKITHPVGTQKGIEDIKELIRVVVGEK